MPRPESPQAEARISRIDCAVREARGATLRALHAMSWCAVVLLAEACVDEASRKTPAPESGASAASASATAQGPAEPPPGIATAEVTQLVEEWLAAQNQRRFEQYEALYASRFEGLKRVGARSFRFDRKGWLRDRAGMFKHRIRVDAKNRQLTIGSVSAVVRFEQTFSAPKFRDVGQKQLVLVREPGGLRIAREEMLSSTLIGSVRKAAAKPLSRDEFSFVKHFGHRTVLVIAPETSEAPRAAAEFLDFHAASRTLPEDRLDAETQAFASKRFALYGPRGKACEGKLGGVFALAHVIPHFGQIQDWKGEQSSTPMSKTRIALELWELSDAPGGRALGGELWGEGCEGALWARTTDAAPPSVYALAKLDEAATDQVHKAFRKLPGHRTFQRQYTRDFGRRGFWDEDERTNRRLIAFEEPGTGEQYIAVSAFAAGCGDFYGEFWALFRKSDGRLALLTDGSAPGALFFPASALDANGDGQPEFVSEFDLVELVSGRFQRTNSVAPPDFDCGC